MDVGGWYIDDLAGGRWVVEPSGTEYDRYSYSTTQYDTVFHRIGDGGAWCDAISANVTKGTANPTTCP